MEFLYVLQLTGGRYYVGKTGDVIKRFEQHRSGNGSAWTKIYHPILLVEVRQITSPHDENNITKDYMKKHGINNVRGGSYAQIKLPDEVNSVLELEFRGNNDLCMKCGLAGHFANKCTSAVSPKVRPPAQSTEEWECEYCDRTFTTKYGCSVHERSCSGQIAPAKKKGGCGRCGRYGHYASGCYARTDIDGNELE
jgi:predicted GIY-YIG superfamily endonuclease